MRIWSTEDMVTVADNADRAYIIDFAETIINSKLRKHGLAGESLFSKAVRVLADHDFEVYTKLGNELIKI